LRATVQHDEQKCKSQGRGWHFCIYTIKTKSTKSTSNEKDLGWKGFDVSPESNDPEGAFMALLPMLQAPGYNSAAGAAGASALSAMPASSELQGGLNLRDVVAFLLFVVLGANPLNASAARDSALGNFSNAMVVSQAKPAKPTDLNKRQLWISRREGET
jgi:hypothetical protein